MANDTVRRKNKGKSLVSVNLKGSCRMGQDKAYSRNEERHGQTPIQPEMCGFEWGMGWFHGRENLGTLTLRFEQYRSVERAKDRTGARDSIGGQLVG
jgi:hypothetical protein